MKNEVDPDAGSREGTPRTSGSPLRASLPGKALFLSFVPAPFLPLVLFGEWGNENEIEFVLNAWVCFAFLWSLVCTFPLVRAVTNRIGRVVLYIFLVPRMVLMNWGAGVFGGCLVVAGHSMLTNSH